MSRVRSMRIALSLGIALILASFLAVAQSDLGSIAGFVKDPTGATVPGATVIAKNELTGTERRTTTNESGYYTVTNIPAGPYTVTVEAKGFKKYESTHNKLDPSASLAIDAPLTVGAASETVEVTATVQRLQTESASVQALVTREQIDMLELNGRNPVGLAYLAPGARGGNSAGLVVSATYQGPSNFNGSRNPENLITYDGAPATRTRSNGAALGEADVDSVQEVQILTAAYAAEYGRTSGAQIRILTRSGTTQFHGALFEYVRNNIFNANTWTRNHTPDVPGLLPFSSAAPVRYNQYGYNIGGPFYIPNKLNRDKNKFFWYWGQEWVKYRFTDSANWTVPTDLMRKGDFSELLTLNPKNVLGRVVQLKDPTTGASIPGNVIPQDKLSQNGLGILKAYPGPNLATPINGVQLYYVTAGHPIDTRKDTLSADINLTDKQRIQFRRLNFSYFEYQPLDGTPTETPKFFNRPNQTQSLDHVWTISPNKVNEFLATVSLDDVYIPVDTAHFLDRTKVGINYPYIFPSGKLIPTRIPTAKITGLNDLTGNPYPSHSTGPIYTVSDSFTWIRGSHTFKFGFYFERSGENDNDEINVASCPTCTNNQNGQFLFSDNRSGQPSTGNALANTAMGLFDTYSELGQRAYTLFRGSSYEPWAQDSWKVNQRFTVNYGVRYTVIVPYKALWGNMIAFDPALYDPSKAVQIDSKTGSVIITPGSDRYNGMVIPGKAFPDSAKGRVPEATAGIFDYLHRGGSYPDYFSKIQWNQVQPRAGIAYQLNDKTVIRAGGGRFYTRLGVSDSVFLGGNPPFQPTANVSFGSADNPGGTVANSLPLTVTTQSREFKNPEAWNWNFTVERELPFKSVVSVAYVGRRGLHLQRESNINQPTPEAVLNAPAGTNLDSLRPYKGYNSIRETDNVASSRYNSLQVTWNRRFSQGLQFGVAYTLSKSSDDGSGQRDIIPDTYFAHNLWGPSEFDNRHILVFSFLYELPIFRGQHNFAGKTLGGWQVSGNAQFQTGTPTNVGRNTDYVGVGVDGSLTGGIGQYWVFNNSSLNYTQQMAHNSGNTDATWWIYPFNESGCDAKGTGCTLKWSAPPKGTFNRQNGIRDFIYNPGFNNWNLGLFKKFMIRESMGFQFRAEAYDAFNHPNWNNANGGNGIGTDPTNLTTFMKITGKNNDVRNIQLSLRFMF